MPRVARLLYWLPATAWMVAIYLGSTGLLAAPRTSRIIGPLLRWLLPGITDPTVETVVFWVRKSAHAAEYGLLALLLLVALHGTFRLLPAVWNWCPVRQAWLLTALYAVSDEIHQAFEPSRHGSPVDVLIDATGAAAALLACWLWWRLRHRSQPGP